MSDALPAMYLMPFRNDESHAISIPISDILDNLLLTYGEIEEEEVLEAESNLRAKVFDITQPIIILFNEMDQLQKLANAASLKFTDAQFLNLGLRLIKNMMDFEKGLTEWYDLPAPRTYIQFKTHFTTAQNNLRKVSSPTMRNGGLLLGR